MVKGLQDGATGEGENKMHVQRGVKRLKDGTERGRVRSRGTVEDKKNSPPRRCADY